MTGSYVPKPEWLMLAWHHACIDAGGLAIQRCTACGTWRHPPRRFCAECHSDAADFVPVAGLGVVRSMAVSHRSMDPGWQEHAPFTTVVVELDEGPRLLAASRPGSDPIPVGAAVQCVIEPRSDDFVLVWAEPTAELATNTT